MLKFVAVVFAATALVVPTTASSAYHAPSKQLLTKYSALWHAAHKECGDCAGRNIRKYGMRTPKGRVVQPQARHVAASIRQLRIIRMPLLTGQPPSQPPAGVQTAAAPPGGTLASIAACESGGNPQAVDPSGTYRGKYQFDYGTWGSVGGSGDPAAASEAEQDMRAAKLYAQRGAAPWPVCGR